MVRQARDGRDGGQLLIEPHLAACVGLLCRTCGSPRLDQQAKVVHVTHLSHRESWRGEVAAKALLYHQCVGLQPGEGFSYRCWRYTEASSQGVDVNSSIGSDHAIHQQGVDGLVDVVGQGLPLWEPCDLRPGL